MIVKLTVDGEQWEFSTVADAAEFKRLKAQPVESTSSESVPPEPMPPARRGRPRKVGGRASSGRVTTVSAANNSVLSDGSRQLLEAVRRIPPAGLESQEFARAIGSPNPWAVPIRMMVLSKELKTVGKTTSDVIKREKIYRKSRAVSLFKRGPDLDEVLGRNGDASAK